MMKVEVGLLGPWKGKGIKDGVRTQVCQSMALYRRVVKQKCEGVQRSVDPTTFSPFVHLKRLFSQTQIEHNHNNFVNYKV